MFAKIVDGKPLDYLGLKINLICRNWDWSLLLLLLLYF